MRQFKTKFSWWSIIRPISKKEPSVAEYGQLSNAQYSLTACEIKALVEAAKSPRDRALIRLFSETGVRRFEAANLLINDVHVNSRMLVIRCGKGRKPRQIPLSATLVRELVQMRLTGQFLFENRRGLPLSLRQINRIVASTARTANIRHPNRQRHNLNCHLLRHSFARLWKATGGSIESLSAILGHASVKTTWDTYGTESLIDIQHNYDSTIELMFRRALNDNTLGTTKKAER